MRYLSVQRLEFFYHNMAQKNLHLHKKACTAAMKLCVLMVDFRDTALSAISIFIDTVRQHL